MKKGKARAGSEAETRSRGKGAEAPVTRAASADEIRRKAYDLYRRRGGAAGSALEDWLQAERDLRRDS